MQTVTDMLSAVSKVDLNYEVQAALIDEAENYKDLQRAQLREGKREDDRSVFNITTGSDEYSPSYAKYKGREKPIDLHDKGDFYNEMFVDVREDSFVIDSADSKSESLQARYGQEIFGLNDENQNTFNDVLQEALIENVTEAISR